MATEQLIKPTKPSNDSWEWEWKDDFEDLDSQGKISGHCRLKITRSGDKFGFEYTLAKCINHNRVGQLQFDVVISSPDHPTNFSLSRGSAEAVPETIDPEDHRLVKREGTIPEEFLKSGSISKAKAGRHIFRPVNVKT